VDHPPGAFARSAGAAVRVSAKVSAMCSQIFHRVALRTPRVCQGSSRQCASLAEIPREFVCERRCVECSYSVRLLCMAWRDSMYHPLGRRQGPSIYPQGRSRRYGPSS